MRSWRLARWGRSTACSRSAGRMESRRWRSAPARSPGGARSSVRGTGGGARASGQRAGVVGIDMIAGPTEVVVVADESADPRYVAADLLAQAEHDEDATAWLITPSEGLSPLVEEELGGC